MAAVRTGLYGLMAFLAVAIALVSARYLIPNAPGLSPNVMANAFTRYGALTAHAGFASAALLLGPWQFIPAIRRRWPTVHRWIGRTYVVSCLAGGLAGLVLAAGSTAGPIGVAGFGALALAWLTVNAQGWRLALARDFARHQRWMIRSYALTFAAVTLRLYLPIAGLLHLDFTEAYRAISWLAWVPNLIVAELMLARGFRTTPLRAAASQSRG